MKYRAKSVIIGKKKKSEGYDGMDRPCFVSFFDINDPHLSGKVPKERIDFEKGIHKIIINDLKIDYLLAGHDIVINDLEEIDIEKDGKGHLVVSGKQRN